MTFPLNGGWTPVSLCSQHCNMIWSCKLKPWCDFHSSMPLTYLWHIALRITHFLLCSHPKPSVCSLTYILGKYKNLVWSSFLFFLVNKNKKILPNATAQSWNNIHFSANIFNSIMFEIVRFYVSLFPTTIYIPYN